MDTPTISTGRDLVPGSYCVEDGKMQTESDQILLTLWEGSGLVKSDDIEDYKCISKDLKIPLIQAIQSSGLVTDFGLQLSSQAQEYVLKEEISPDLAIRALRIAVQQKLSLPVAIKEAEKLHQKTQVVVSAANKLTDLMIKAKMLTPKALGPLLVMSHESSVMIGQVMVLNNVISSDNLLSVLNAILMIRETNLSEEDAVKGLMHSYRQESSFEQALFELGLFVSPDSKTTRIGELFLMSGLITNEDLAECLEIELFKEKQFGQILLERGLATTEQLHCAVNLLSFISNGELNPYQAANALYKVCKEGTDFYAVLAELKATPVTSNTRLGDMLIESGVCSSQNIEDAMASNVESAVKIGSKLLKSGIINDHVLYIALRFQTAQRLGYVSRSHAVQLLKLCFIQNFSLEKACAEANIYIPSRMQWTWV